MTDYSMPEGKCWRCKHPFTEENVFTPAGYRELFISGTCEACFDEVMGGDEFEETELFKKGGC